MKRKLSKILVLIFCSLVATGSIQAAEKRPLAGAEELFQVQQININSKSLAQWTQAKSGSIISLPWFGSSNLEFKVQSVTEKKEIITLTGSAAISEAKEDGGDAVFVIGQNQIAGAVTLGTENYRVWPAEKKNRYSLLEVNSDDLPEFPDVQTFGNHSENDPHTLSNEEENHIFDLGDKARRFELAQADTDSRSKYILAENGNRIDILVAYSSESLDWAQQRNINIDLAIELMVGTTNLHFVTSGISTRLNLVGTTEFDHTVLDPTLDLDLTVLATRYGTYSDLHTLRNTLKADLVSFLVLNGEQGCKFEDGTICGLARLPSRYMEPGDFPGIDIGGETSWESDFASKGFSVVSIYNAFHDYTFTHEIGHNLGAHHDKWAHYYVNGSPTVEINARGWVMPEIRTRTVMSYNTLCREHGFKCHRLPLFSNPLMTIGNIPQGDPVAGSLPAYLGPADNVSVINKMARTVSNYRQRFVAP